jgi:DNA gyrase/topoisomerase IV subunit B
MNLFIMVVLLNLFKCLNKNKQVLHDNVIYVEGKEDNISIEVAMQYNNSYNENLFLLLIIFILLKVELMKMELKEL